MGKHRTDTQLNSPERDFDVLERAAKLADQEGLFYVFKKFIKSEYQNHKYNSAMMSLIKIISAARDGDETALKLWLRACGMRATGKKMTCWDRIKRRQIREILESEPAKRSEELTDFLVFQCSMYEHLDELNKKLSTVGQGHKRPSKDRTIDLPITRTLSKNDCLIILDFALEIFENHSRQCDPEMSDIAEDCESENKMTELSPDRTPGERIKAYYRG